MPLYEYTCAKCGERFEIVSSHAGREEQAVCPACGSREVTRVFSAFRVGISRSKLNPGTFERPRGGRPKYTPPGEG
jgi:putative FmdB family regulatory protein